jgi:hypothetical protein
VAGNLAYDNVRSRAQGELCGEDPSIILGAECYFSLEEGWCKQGKGRVFSFGQISNFVPREQGRAGQGRAGLRDAPQPRLRAGAALAVTVAMALSRVRQ